MYQNKVLNHMSTRLPKLFFIHELEKSMHLSHKRTLWIEEPELKFRKKASRRTQKRTKSPKAQRCKMAWEWGTNGYFCLPYVTILWCLSWKLLEERGKKKVKLISLASKELSWLWILSSHFLNWTIIND